MMRFIDVFNADGANNNVMPSFSRIAQYFTDQINARKNQINNQPELIECEQFLVSLDHFEKNIVEEFNESVKKNDFISQKYIFNFTIKLSSFTNVMTSSDHYEELDAAFSDLMVAVENPLGKRDKLACLFAGMVGAILYSVLGAATGVGACILATIFLLCSMISPVLIAAQITTMGFLFVWCAAIGAGIGGVVGAVIGAGKGYHWAEEKIKSHHSENIKKQLLIYFMFL